MHTPTLHDSAELAGAMALPDVKFVLRPNRLLASPARLAAGPRTDTHAETFTQHALRKFQASLAQASGASWEASALTKSYLPKLHLIGQ